MSKETSVHDSWVEKSAEIMKTFPHGVICIYYLAESITCKVYGIAFSSCIHPSERDKIFKELPDKFPDCTFKLHTTGFDYVWMSPSKGKMVDPTTHSNDDHICDATDKAGE